VGDDEGGPSLHGPVHGLLDLPLHLEVQGGCGLVEDEDPRVADHRPGYGDALPLPSAQGDAPLPHLGFEPFGEGFNEREDPRDVRGLPYLFRRKFRQAVGDVEGDGPLHQEGFLGDDADLLPKFPEVHPPEIGPVHEDGTSVGVVEPGDEVGEGGLARSRRAHQGHFFPRDDFKGDVPEDRLPLRVGEGDVPEGDAPFQHPQRDGVHRGFDLPGNVQEAEDALRGGKAELHGADHGGEDPDGLDKETEVPQEGDELSGCWRPPPLPFRRARG
jgi:hypothetical protein